MPRFQNIQAKKTHYGSFIVICIVWKQQSRLVTTYWLHKSMLFTTMLSGTLTWHTFLKHLSPPGMQTRRGKSTQQGALVLWIGLGMFGVRHGVILKKWRPLLDPNRKHAKIHLACRQTCQNSNSIGLCPFQLSSTVPSFPKLLKGEGPKHHLAPSQGQKQKVFYLIQLTSPILLFQDELINCNSLNLIDHI